MGAWTIKAEGGIACADRQEVRRAMSILFTPGEWHELRALPSGRGRVVQVDDLDIAYAAVESLADEQVYYCLNPISQGAERASKTTVVCRRWFLIDVDAIKPKDASSTEAEKIKALLVAGTIFEYLTSLGWPAPLMVDSGNGWHLLYRIDLPNDKLSQQILKSCLYVLAERFKSEDAIVDVSTHDAPRVSKLPGTMARKGADTPDRPHRMARIYIEPTQIDVVSTALLQSLGSPPAEQPANTNGVHHTDPWTAKAYDGPGLTSYVRGAIERECFRVALAPPGERNNILNTAAFSLGTMTGWPEMHEHEARATLQLAAERAGLPERETLITIASGWKAGTAQPRQRPQEPARNTSKKRPAGKLTIGADEVEPQKVTWLWPDRIALGFINLFAGRTGVGKSFVLCDVASRLSRGIAFPDGSPARPIGGTLFVSEDPYRVVLVPRLMELGADRSKIGFMKWAAMASYQLSDTDFLQDAWEERNRPELIVIDPPANFLGGKDEHKNAEIRSVLMKLVEWLENKPVGMALITHYNKGGAQKALDALDRIMGSVAWSSSARVACGFVANPDEQDRCIFGGIKNNLGPKAEPLSYTIRKTDSLATVDWFGKSKTSFDDAMGRTKKKSRAENAAEWLVERFRERQSWPSDDLYDLGRTAGVSRSALWEAAETLPIKRQHISPQDGGKRFWQWSAQPDWPPAEILETVEILSSNSNQDKDLESVSISDEERNAEWLPETHVNRSPESVSSVPSVSTILKAPEIDLTPALRWLSTVVTRSPIPRSEFVNLGNAILIDEPNLDGAAEVLKVERTLENGVEMWSLP